MDDLIQQLEHLTLQLIERIDQVSYEEVEVFVEQREQIIGNMQLSDIPIEDSLKYREQVQRLLSHDSIILEKMNTLMQEASTGLHKIHSSRRQSTVYRTAYTPDSIFFDKRK